MSPTGYPCVPKPKRTPCTRQLTFREHHATIGTVEQSGGRAMIVIVRVFAVLVLDAFRGRPKSTPERPAGVFG